MTDNLLTTQQIWIDKSNLVKTNVVQQMFDPAALKAGEVLLKIDSFGFSANNITYALLGEKMGYWGFFPAPNSWGIIPVWGFATVALSNVEGIEVGEKLFGYLPMASHWVVKPDKVSAHGFFDVHPQRKSISPVYDNYLRCAQDLGYDVNKEAIQMNIRPLFMTSFVLDDFVAEHIDTKVQDIILTSASSKTAYGTAHLLHKHKADRGLSYRVIGLTSASNKAFTEQLGCYDQVICYADIQQLDVDNGVWILDFAGNKKLLLELQQTYADNLHKMIFIGATDVQAQNNKASGQLNGEVFFAPAQVKKRVHEWSQQKFSERYTQAWKGFLHLIDRNVVVANYVGVNDIEAVYLQALTGKLSNQNINVLTF
ncbi:DUF2855 family protein [Paraglaciecola sp.]|uniref:DUF2855 family protein n=1 Tax=Paraglaciecola sp. TaxID=1920173 RepID=UPI0030F373DE